MSGFLSIYKMYFYIGLVVAVIAGGSYFLYDWHYSVISTLKKEKTSLETQLKTTGSHLNVCEANLSKQLLKGFIDGVGGHNEDISISLDNLHT